MQMHGKALNLIGYNQDTGMVGTQFPRTSFLEASGKCKCMAAALAKALGPFAKVTTQT